MATTKQKEENAQDIERAATKDWQEATLMRDAPLGQPPSKSAQTVVALSAVREKVLTLQRQCLAGSKSDIDAAPDRLSEIAADLTAIIDAP